MMKTEYGMSHKKTKQPWSRRYHSAKDRCTNKSHPSYNYYSSRGIKMDLGFWEMGVLWWRDNADEMKRPSIDRIDNMGNYEFNNCRFIEQSENASRGLVGIPRTEETKRKMSEAKKGEKSVNYGKHHSKEIRQKISKAMKGKFHGKEI